MQAALAGIPLETHSISSIFNLIMYHAKTVFVGDEGVGKRSLLHCLVDGLAIGGDEYLPRYGDCATFICLTTGFIILRVCR